MDSLCPTPLFITGGMNNKKSSWRAREKTGSLTGDHGENGGVCTRPPRRACLQITTATKGPKMGRQLATSRVLSGQFNFLFREGKGCPAIPEGLHTATGEKFHHRFTGEHGWERWLAGIWGMNRILPSTRSQIGSTPN